MQRDFSSIGLHVPEILLPASGADWHAWAVVACDQYTSQPEYWAEVERLTRGKPSTYHLMLPEAYLGAPDEAERVAKIQAAMRKALQEKALAPQAPGFLLVERRTEHGAVRHGLMVALDLECYDFSVGSQTLIRATEGTILDRLPPRMRVREGAPIELPHIMVLLDDPGRTVIEPVTAAMQAAKPVYDTKLMMGGGHVRGWKVEREDLVRGVAAAIAKLADPAAFGKRYGPGKGVLLYAVGDGNHSLATAKSIWEKRKAAAKDKQAVMSHPARYALVELMNVHDQGLAFEAIHRVLFGVDEADLWSACRKHVAARGGECLVHPEPAPAPAVGSHVVRFVAGSHRGTLEIRKPKLTLPVATLQEFLDEYLKAHPAAKIDYIHGDDVVERLGSQPGHVGLFLPVMDKGDLFTTVIRDGALPRKTFSMGEAPEKRYYLECRRIEG